MRSIRVFLTLTLLSVATLLNFAAALRGYHRGMVEAQSLFNRRMHQHLDLLNYSLPDLLARGDIEGGHVRYAARGVASEANLEFQWLRPDGALIARSEGMPDTPAAPLEAGQTPAPSGQAYYEFMMARRLEAQNDLTGALAALQRAIGLDPTYFEAYFNLGNIHHDHGRFLDAEACYREALGLNPGYADAHFYLAVTLEKMGRSADARAHWRAYQALAPTGEWIELAREFSD